jgi:ribosomal protein S18 acetylase RimI-like enzyme
LGAIDNSFITHLVYRVRRDTLSFRLEVETVDPPIRKSYGSLLADVDRVRRLGHVVVAEQSGALVGVVAADLSGWNRRVQIEHLYVAADARGRGNGRALVDSVVSYARDVRSWCIWLETQNTNHPAIQFYLRYGFRLCGLDERLYDPATQSSKETALYFALDLT